MGEDPFEILVKEPERGLRLIMARHGSQLKKRIKNIINNDDELVKDAALLVCHAEQLHKCRLRRQLDGDNRVSNTCKDGLCQEGHVGSDHFHVVAAHRANNHQRKSTRVGRIAWLDDGRKGLKDSLGSLIGLGRI